MKVIIAGSRGISDVSHVVRALVVAGFSGNNLTEIVSGGARGVDQLGETVARVNGIPCKQFPADWDRRGKSAGYIRNKQMAEYADFLVAVWDGASQGTRNMIETMDKLGKGVHVHKIEVTP